MNKNNTIWIRITYWAGAIGDIIVGILIWFPQFSGLNTYQFPTGYFSGVAISWGIMLLYADRKPLERRWVLVPTMFAVMTLFIVNLQAIITGNMPLFRLFIPIFYLSLIIISLITTRNIDK